MLKNTVLYKEKQLKIGIFSRPVGMKVGNVGYCSLLWRWMFFYFQFWPPSWKIYISVSARSSRMNRRRSTEKATPRQPRITKKWQPTVTTDNQHQHQRTDSQQPSVSIKKNIRKYSRLGWKQKTFSWSLLHNPPSDRSSKSIDVLRE